MLTIPPSTKLWFAAAVGLRLGFDGLANLVRSQFATILDGIDLSRVRRFKRFSLPPG